MLDPKYIRKNPDKILEKRKENNYFTNLSKFIEKDKERIFLLNYYEKLREVQNNLTAQISNYFNLNAYLKTASDLIKNRRESIEESIKPLKIKIDTISDLIKNRRESIEESIKPLKIKIDTISDLIKNHRESIEESIKPFKIKVDTISDLIKNHRESIEESIKPFLKITNDLKESIKTLKIKVDTTIEESKNLLLKIPNIPDEDVPLGNSDDENIVIRENNPRKEYNQTITQLSHCKIAEKLDILDLKRASKISGSKFSLYKGDGAKLERSLINFFLDTHTKNGYTEILPPFIVNEQSMIGTGQLPKFKDDMYYTNDNLYLIPTAEVPLTNIHRNEILKEEDLPIKYCAYTPCFRREAGAAGKSGQGLIRQHQFNKVELVKLTTQENAYKEFENLIKDVENILKALKLRYRLVLVCAKDMGFSAAKQYDFEVYMPSYDKFIEISSCSIFRDFQARRLNIKYIDKKTKEKKFVYTMNGSGLAVGRTVAAILENYYYKNTLNIPTVLQNYMNKKEITSNK